MRGGAVLAASGPAAQAQYAFVDLNPTDIAGVSRSFGFGAGGGQQAGYYIDAQGRRRGLLEAGNLGTAADLTPSAASESILYATDGAHQAGWAILDPNLGHHAMIAARPTASRMVCHLFLAGGWLLTTARLSEGACPSLPSLAFVTPLRPAREGIVRNARVMRIKSSQMFKVLGASNHYSNASSGVEPV